MKTHTRETPSPTPRQDFLRGLTQPNALSWAIALVGAVIALWTVEQWIAQGGIWSQPSLMLQDERDDYGHINGQLIKLTRKPQHPPHIRTVVVLGSSSMREALDSNAEAIFTQHLNQQTRIVQLSASSASVTDMLRLMEIVDDHIDGAVIAGISPVQFYSAPAPHARSVVDQRIPFKAQRAEALLQTFGKAEAPTVELSMTRQAPWIKRFILHKWQHINGQRGPVTYKTSAYERLTPWPVERFEDAELFWKNYDGLQKHASHGKHHRQVVEAMIALSNERTLPLLFAETPVHSATRAHVDTLGPIVENYHNMWAELPPSAHWAHRDIAKIIDIKDNDFYNHGHIIRGKDAYTKALAVALEEIWKTTPPRQK